MSFWSSIKSLGRLTFGSNVYSQKSQWSDKMGKFTDLEALDINGEVFSMKAYEGKVLIVTNVACKCGYTKGSYDAMQDLSQKYYKRGLRILCFPCNQFMGQEPWTAKEIQDWVTGNWPSLRPEIFGKIEVNGDNTHQVYKFLKEAFPGDIKWNFASKFVVGANGIPVQRFDKDQSWSDIEQCIETELGKVSPAPAENADDEKQGSLDELSAVDAKVQKQINQMQGDLDALVAKTDKAKQENEEQAKEKGAFNAEAYVDKLVSENPVVMISKSYCPFCTKANSILAKHTQNITKIDIDKEFSEEDMATIQAYCKQKTGASSVPRVWINGTLVGGCDDTEKLDKEQKLKELLA